MVTTFALFRFLFTIFLSQSQHFRSSNRQFMSPLCHHLFVEYSVRTSSYKYSGRLTVFWMTLNHPKVT